ncbi:MAG: hypothetical protein C4554_04430 [Dethiobacter sp.]|nr:MAG: hypothetical protein C4554_04430 [Dethiobacter sp.]
MFSWKAPWFISGFRLASPSELPSMVAFGGWPPCHPGRLQPSLHQELLATQTIHSTCIAAPIGGAGTEKVNFY